MRRNKELTDLAYEMAVFVDPKRRSFISNQVHPGSEHYCVFLRGRDRSIRREELFKRTKGICAGCGRYRDLKHGDMHHEVMRGRGGCDCFANLTWRCKFFVGDCHTKLHPQIRSGKLK